MTLGFEQDIRLFIDRTVGPEAAKRMLITRAREALADFMARQSVKPMVHILTDGRETGTEDTVKPFGVIRYEFSRIREVVSFALRELERLSPVLSGRYRRSWITLIDRVQVGMDQVDGGQPVMIVNFQPYARKIHVGSRGFEVPAGIVEKVRQIVLRRFRRMISVNIQFIELNPGYTLKKPPRTGRRMTYPALVIAPF